jgi:hypothetical protein
MVGDAIDRREDRLQRRDARTTDSLSSSDVVSTSKDVIERCERGNGRTAHAHSRWAKLKLLVAGHLGPANRAQREHELCALARLFGQRRSITA